MNKTERLTLVVLLGGVAAIGPFSIDMYLPGFPAIAKSFSVEAADVSYTLTGYFIGISIGQLIYGPLIDRYGRKKPLLLGLLLYALASLACALSPNLWSLVGSRFVQALGASVGMVASMAIIRDQFPVAEVARMLSSILLVMGVAPVIAPTLGSFLLTHFSWEAIFVFLSLVAVVLLGNLFFFLKETQGANTAIELRLKPIFSNYVRTLQQPAFTFFSLSGSIAMSILFAYIASISFVLMSLYGVDKSTFGLLFGLNAFGFILGSQVNNLLLKRWHLYRLTRLMSFLQVLVSVLFLLSVCSLELSLWAMSAFTFSILFLLGFINPNATALSLEKIKTHIGVASALNGSMRMALGALVSFLVGSLADGTVFPFVASIFVLSVLSFVLLLIGKKYN